MLLIVIMLGIRNLIEIIKIFVNQKSEEKRLKKLEESMWDLGEAITDEMIEKMTVIIYEKGVVEKEEKLELKFGDE